MTLTAERIVFLRSLIPNSGMDGRERMEAGELLNAAESLALAGLEPGDVKTLVELVRQIVLSLPAKQDWLDPAVERTARALLARLPK